MSDESRDCGCDEPRNDVGTVDFSTFVLSLGTSALYHLGQGTLEGSGKPMTNLPMARHVIDLVAMLQSKTEGNLTEEERGLVETLLLDLRLKYVDVCKRQSQNVEP